MAEICQDSLYEKSYATSMRKQIITPLRVSAFARCFITQFVQPGSHLVRATHERVVLIAWVVVLDVPFTDLYYIMFKYIHVFLLRVPAATVEFFRQRAT